MKKSLRLLCICFSLISSGQLLAGSIPRQTTGTSTETSTSTSSTSSTGSCVGDSTAEKSTSPSDTTLVSGCSVTPPEVDDDGDGMISSWEVGNGLEAHDSADKLLDLDNDYISNLVEFLRNLKANDADYDNDGVVDGDDIEPSNASLGGLQTLEEFYNNNSVFNGSVITEDNRPK